LVHQHVAVSQEQDSFFAPCLPQSPDDLKGGVGFAGSRRHDKQNAVASFGDGFDGGVDGIDLIVARGFAAAIVKIILKDDGLFFGGQAFPRAIACPQVFWRGEGIVIERGFFFNAGAAPVMEDEPITVGGEDEGRLQRFGIVEGLLHAVADGMSIVLGFDHRNGDVGLVTEDVVSPLGLAPADQLPAHDDATLGETDLLADLRHLVPACLAQGRGDELGTNVALAQVFLTHKRMIL